LDRYIQHVSILINGTPQVVLPAFDLDEAFIQMPRISR